MGSGVGKCLVCGAKLPTPKTGRRPHYCGNAHRQAASRLRSAHGPDWWKRQQWYVDLVAEDERAKAAAKAEQARVRAMPPEMRQAYQAAAREQSEAEFRELELSLARDDARLINEKYAHTLEATGHAVRLMPVSHGRVERLLWSAVTSDSEAEALAMLAKARKLAASESRQLPEAHRSLEELLHRMSLTN
jgi:hypothetical protein